MQAFTYAERPDLAARRDEVEDTFPAWLHHASAADPVVSRWWRSLTDELPHLQLLLYDDERDRVVGRAHTVPAREAEGLPPGGVDGVLVGWFEQRVEPDVLCAVVAVVDRSRQGEGLSGLVIGAMREAAAREGFPALVAPVRPTRKADYPLIPLERYASWKRPDGLPFDPWLRLHVRLGAKLLQVCPESMRCEAGVSEWEEWTGMVFPEDGDYVVPGALVPLSVRGGRGIYVEPNVWMRHTSVRATSGV